MIFANLHREGKKIDIILSKIIAFTECNEGTIIICDGEIQYYVDETVEQVEHFLNVSK